MSTQLNAAQYYQFKHQYPPSNHYCKIYLKKVADRRLFEAQWQLHRRKSSEEATTLPRPSVHDKRCYHANLRLRKSIPPGAVYSPRQMFKDQKKIKLSNDRKDLRIGGRRRQFTANQTSSAKGKPSPQLTQKLVRDLHSEIVSPAMGEVVRLKFPASKQSKADTTTTVLYATKDSDCPALRELWKAAFTANNTLNDDLDEMEDTIVTDGVGGGYYHNFGFGWQSNQKGSPYLEECGRVPIILKSTEHPRAQSVWQNVGSIMSAAAVAILKYAPQDYDKNQVLCDCNPSVACPPIHYQTHGCHWYSTQFITRRLGLGRLKGSKSPEQNKSALHCDSGDANTKMPLIYIPGGGPQGRGGAVSDSDLLVCGATNGGHSARIKTNIPNTVTVILMNSNQQLHGVIDDKKAQNDDTAWSTRIIPFIQEPVLKWMQRNPLLKPWRKYDFPTNS